MDKLNRRLGLVSLFLLGILTTVFLTMLLFNVTDYGITIASFGATAFMVLARKNVEKRRIFGAYLIATFIGYFFSRFQTNNFSVALATVASFLAMTFFEVQHPPALAMSVAVILNRFTFWTNILIVLCIFTILFMTITLKAFWKNPNKVLTFLQIEREKINWNFLE